MVVASAKRDQLAADEAVAAGLNPFEERQSRRCRPARQKRGDGQEELVDQTCGGERPERVRPGLEQDQLMAAFLRAHGEPRADRSPLPTPMASPRLLQGRGRGAVPRRPSMSGSPCVRRVPGAVRRSHHCRSGSQVRGAQALREVGGARRTEEPSRGADGLETRCRWVSREASRSRRRSHRQTLGGDP